MVSAKFSEINGGNIEKGMFFDNVDCDAIPKGRYIYLGKDYENGANVCDYDTKYLFRHLKTGEIFEFPSVYGLNYVGKQSLGIYKNTVSTNTRLTNEMLNKGEICEISGNFKSSFADKEAFIKEFQEKIDTIIPNLSDSYKEKYKIILKMLNPHRSNILFFYYSDESEIFRVQEFIAKILPNMKKKHINFEKGEVVDRNKIDYINEAIGNDDVRIIYYNNFDNIINNENGGFLNAINRSRDKVNKTHIYFIKEGDRIKRDITGHLGDYKEFAFMCFLNE